MGYISLDGDNKASLMTSNLFGSTFGSEKLSFSDWNKIDDSSYGKFLNFLDDSNSYIRIENSHGFYAYKIDKPQYLGIMMMIKLNNMFYIIILINDRNYV